MKAHIVVGLGFGDEGKGMTTDFLCSQNPDSIVVRFNGGQQATHTVMREGVKHSFSSFCSGTLLGIPSYISEFCCFYPPSIHAEGDDLLRKGITPVLYIHPLAKLTTPYDIAFNRMRESKLKHGSTGVGIGATFSRNIANYTLHAADMVAVNLLDQKLSQISTYYLSLLRDYDDSSVNYYYEIVKEEFKFFYKALSTLELNIAGYDYLKQFSTVIFEGGQGIMLDMEFGIFPHVTYSYCTSRNALSICNSLGINDIDIHYVTRCYQTRHGNGWMSNHTTIPLINNEEEINTLGDWQGIFRLGELDTKLLNYAMNCDDIYSFGHNKHLHVTCLDQRPGFTFPYDKLKMPFRTVREQFSPDASLKHYNILEKAYI